MIIRGLQAVFTVISLSLAGALVANHKFGGSPSEVNFALFATIFAFLSLFYYMFSVFSDGHVKIELGLDVMNLLFTFASATALAAALGVHSCGNQGYIDSNKITNGSYDHTKRCHEGQALDAFLWFLFISFLVSLALTAVKARRGGASMSASRSRV